MHRGSEASAPGGLGDRSGTPVLRRMKAPEPGDEAAGPTGRTEEGFRRTLTGGTWAYALGPPRA